LLISSYPHFSDKQFINVVSISATTISIYTPQSLTHSRREVHYSYIPCHGDNHVRKLWRNGALESLNINWKPWTFSNNL